MKTQTAEIVNGEEQLEDLLSQKELSIPLGTDVQIEVGGVGFKLQSRMVGAVNHEYLILKTPSTANLISINTKLYVGNIITVRYLNDGTVYGFQSELVSVISEPAKLIFISYPKMIASRDLRAHKRLHCCIPAKTKIQDREYDTIIKDIGMSGCRFLMKYSGSHPRPALEVGATISSSVQFLLGLNEHKLVGEVKNITLDHHTMNIGVQFKKADKEIQENITKYISLFSEI